MQDNLNTQNYLQEEVTIDIKKEAGYYLFFWPWFIGAMLVAVVGSYLYLRTADRVYEANSQLQIKKAESDPTSFLTGGMDLFGFDKVNVENDIAVLTSQHILSQVVERLDLQTQIYTIGRVNELLRFNDKDTERVGPIVFKNKNTTGIWDINVEGTTAKIAHNDSIYTIKKGEVFDTKDITLTFNDSFFKENMTYSIRRFSLNKTVANIKRALLATPASKQGEIVNLNFTGVNPLRNEAILNALMGVLAEDQVKDKRKISEVSIDFIDERLKGLTKSIDTISQNTIAYQMASGIFDPATQTGNALTSIIKGQEEAFSIGIQLEIAKGLLEKLQAQQGYTLLPANVGIDNENVNSLVNSYNTVITQRNNLLMSTTTKSPVVLQLSSQLDNAKAAIVTGVNRYIEGLQTSLTSFQQMQAKTRGVVASLPSKENTLRAFARNFKIVEELYVFLLERKEEASISYISALPNIKMLSYGCLLYNQ